VIVSALALVLVCATPARPAVSLHRPHNCGKLTPRLELRCARHQLAQARAELAAPLPSPPHSRSYWQWRKNVARRWVRVARYRIGHPPLPHLRLWLCIHSGEGSWNDPDSGHNSHFGGLQMTSPWGRGAYYVFRADWLSPYEQMRAAETGYRASGYSFPWLEGQWWHPECFQYA
jgi:hypothetical protein